MIAVIGIAAAVIVLAAIALLYNRLVGLRNKTRYTWGDCDARAGPPGAGDPAAGRGRGGRDGARTLGVRGRRGRPRRHAGASPDEGPSEARFAAERQLGVASAGLVAVAEAYPQLRASEAAAELIAALKDVEGDLRRARMVYNRTVQTYEDARQTFPSSLVAGAFRFGPLPYFSD